MVGDLLEGVLERGERRAVGALTLSVGLDRAVVGLRPRLLRLFRRTPEGARQLLLGGHDDLHSSLETNGSPRGATDDDFPARRRRNRDGPPSRPPPVSRRRNRGMVT